VEPLRLGFFASHEGSNLQAILDACRAGTLAAEPRLVISNNSDSGALRRAREAGVPAYHVSGRTHPDDGVRDEEHLRLLRTHGVNLVVLAGYMKKLGPRALAAYRGRILSIHPALLPKYGGPGMYGERVHEAVLAAGEKETGVTVHLVTADYDAGPLLAQCRVPVLPGDTVQTLRARVLAREHEFFVETLRKIAGGEIALPLP
jgi:phosphoribosylglycinamide formyltransferase-1